MMPKILIIKKNTIENTKNDNINSDFRTVF